MDSNVPTLYISNLLSKKVLIIYRDRTFSCPIEYLTNTKTALLYICMNETLLNYSGVDGYNQNVAQEGTTNRQYKTFMSQQNLANGIVGSQNQSNMAPQAAQPQANPSAFNKVGGQ